MLLSLVSEVDGGSKGAGARAGMPRTALWMTGIKAAARTGGGARTGLRMGVGVGEREWRVDRGEGAWGGPCPLLMNGRWGCESQNVLTEDGLGDDTAGFAWGATMS